MSEHPVLNQAVSRYVEVFGDNPTVKVFAPGRVNLIGKPQPFCQISFVCILALYFSYLFTQQCHRQGEHTDYNGGFVLPFALPFKTVVVGSLSSEKESKVVSCSMGPDPEIFTIDEHLCKGQPSWVNYVKGTIFQYLQDLPSPLAVNLCIASNVPLGSGLSSSASLEVAVATFLEQLCGLQTSGVTKALRCQRAEHDFADTPCGVMDQYISAMGKRGNLLLIDCRSNEYTLVPFGNSSSTTRQPVLLITNSNVKHSLADSQYPVRVQQCQAAVRALAAKFPHITSLRDAT